MREERYHAFLSTVGDWRTIGTSWFIWHTWFFTLIPNTVPTLEYLVWVIYFFQIQKFAVLVAPKRLFPFWFYGAVMIKTCSSDTVGQNFIDILCCFGIRSKEIPACLSQSWRNRSSII